MAKINLITAPDKLYNSDTSFLLIYPSNPIKEQFNSILQSTTSNVNLYLYEHESDSHDIDWLLSVHQTVDYCIIDLDNSPSEIRELVSYFISKSNTYWLTNGEYMFYNSISNNKIWNLDYFINEIGGPFETQTK